MKQFGNWTYKLLRAAGLLDFVYLFLQSNEDEHEYRKAYPELKVVRSPLGLRETANFATKFFAEGTKVIQLHDDIKAIIPFEMKDAGNGKGPKPSRGKPMTTGLNLLFTELFKHMEDSGAHLGGSNCNNDPRCELGNRDAVSTKNAFIFDPVTAQAGL